MREMKDSGFDWIGETPSDWQLIKGKYIFKQRNSKGNSFCLQLLSPSQKFGVVPQTLLEELTTQNVVKVKEDTDLSAFKTIHIGDFCISLRSFQGGSSNFLRSSLWRLRNISARRALRVFRKRF